MIEVNNFEKLKSIIDFNEKEKDIVLVWVVKRNKDGNTTAKGNNKNRTIKSYHLQSLAQLEMRLPEIKKLCQTFNCRAYICVNPKPVIKVLFRLQAIVMENIQNQLSSGSVMLLKGMLDSAVMKAGTRGKDKKWVVDVDSKDYFDLADAEEKVKNARSENKEGNLIDIVPTAHGYHLITHPFDIRALEGTPYDIKKDGLTLLYAYLNE